MGQNKSEKWNKAELTKVKNTERQDYLEVLVMHEKAESLHTEIPGVGNTPDRKAIGVILFRDNREASEIIKFFARIHGTPYKIGETEDYAYARYIQQYEATIPHAFVLHFSKKLYSQDH